MDVRLSAEQQLLAEATADLAAEVAGRWRLGRGPDGAEPPEPDAHAWRLITDAGLLGLRLAESAGGSAATCLDVCVVAEQLGRHCVPAPIIGSLLLVEQLRVRDATEELVGAIAAGRRRAAPALTGDLTAFATASDGARGWDCAGATDVVVVGRTEARLYPVTAHRSVDPTRWFGRLAAGDVPREAVPLRAPASAESDARCDAFALSVLCADLLGVMQAALDACVAHARSRTQFGAPIGSFQAIAHLAAECLVSVEAARSAVWYSAWAADELAPTEASQVARAAKAFVSEAAIGVTEAAVQIHGGMGMTWEARPHLWLRRAHTDRRLLGDEQAQYAALAAARLAGDQIGVGG